MLAVSDAEERQLRTIGVEPDGIRLVPNPIDLDEFVPARERGRFRQRIGVTSAPIVLFLGRITPRKRVDVLVRACARLLARPDARLVIAGNDLGPAGHVRQLAHAAGVGDRVLFTGLLRGHERLEALADADVLVYPSEDEIFGLVPLEAILCGTPVIVADGSGCAEVVRKVGGGQSRRLVTSMRSRTRSTPCSNIPPSGAPPWPRPQTGSVRLTLAMWSAPSSMTCTATW